MWCYEMIVFDIGERFLISWFSEISPVGFFHDRYLRCYLISTFRWTGSVAMVITDIRSYHTLGVLGAVDRSILREHFRLVEWVLVHVFKSSSIKWLIDWYLNVRVLCSGVCFFKKPKQPFGSNALHWSLILWLGLAVIIPLVSTTTRLNSNDGLWKDGKNRVGDQQSQGTFAAKSGQMDLANRFKRLALSSLRPKSWQRSSKHYAYCTLYCYYYYYCEVIYEMFHISLHIHSSRAH